MQQRAQMHAECHVRAIYLLQTLGPLRERKTDFSMLENWGTGVDMYSGRHEYVGTNRTIR